MNVFSKKLNFYFRIESLSEAVVPWYYVTVKNRLVMSKARCSIYIDAIEHIVSRSIFFLTFLTLHRYYFDIIAPSLNTKTMKILFC